AATGLGCLSLDGNFVFGLGEFCYLAAACMFSLTFVLTSRAAATIPAIALTSVQLTMVGLVALPLSLILEEWQLPQTVDIWLWVLASTLIATCVRFFLQTWAQGKTASSSAALIMVLEPVWTAFLAAFWFAERMSPIQMLGCGLIFTALLVSRWRYLIHMANMLLTVIAV
ncbi:DMT family transporter, partial [Wenyingzhuangia sp. 1_MG-2023]|nr:DMT family transporter [Wenyingzhuangia sp. 1_MG-2023]